MGVLFVPKIGLQCRNTVWRNIGVGLRLQFQSGGSTGSEGHNGLNFHVLYILPATHLCLKTLRSNSR
jgi:hypothetical protein